MKVVSKDDVLENKDFYLDEIKSGKIFIYPTDTVLGIGCNACNHTQVEKIFEIKKRDSKSCLIVVPSINWIETYCETTKGNLELMREKLPGPYSFIIKLKNNSLNLSRRVIGEGNTIGVRIPKNWFWDLIHECQTPFVSTSVNISGEESAKSIYDVEESIKSQVDYVVSDNDFSGKHSSIIDLKKEPPEIIR